MSVPVQQAILGRRSIRSYRPEPVTESQLETLTRAALASPSAMDRQPWQFHFVVNPQVIGQLSDAAYDTFRAQGQQDIIDRMASRGAANLFYGAPLVVVISVPAAQPSPLDAGIAAQTLALAAQGLGLGSCIIAMAGAAFAGDRAAGCRQALSMADDRVFGLCVAIGTSAAGKDAHPVHPEKIIWVR